MKETPYRKRYAFRGKVIHVRNDRIRLPNRNLAVREYIEHPGAVAALAFVDPRHIILLRQYRYPIGAVTWEIPAGKLDHGERPRDCVLRELSEEAGVSARRVRRLTSFWPTAAFSTEIIHLYACWDLFPVAAQPDDDEFLVAEHIPITRALEWVHKGRIKDSKTIIALLFWDRFQKRSLPR